MGRITGIGRERGRTKRPVLLFVNLIFIALCVAILCLTSWAALAYSPLDYSGLMGSWAERVKKMDPIMRHAQRAYTKKVWIALLAFFLGGVGYGGGLALCFGADGHVAVEAAPSGSCDDSSGVLSQAVSRFSPEKLSALAAYCCNPCVDLPVSEDAPDQQCIPPQAPQQKKTPNSAKFAGASSAFSEFDATDPRPVFPPPATDAPTASFRTAVLLI